MSNEDVVNVMNRWPPRDAKQIKSPEVNPKPRNKKLTTQTLESLGPQTN